MANEILDPDYLAFLKAQNEGRFSTLTPGTFVAFYNGIWIATASSFEEITSLDATQDLYADLYIDQVGRQTPVRTVNRGSRIVRRT